MELLWPGRPAARAGNSLRQVLHHLRRELGGEVFLPESAEGLRLDPDRWSVDLWTFRTCLEEGDLEGAVDAYRGPFLDGFQVGEMAAFDAWIQERRDALAGQYGSALDALARAAEEAGHLDEAVAWRRRQAAADPLSARVTLALLRTLADAGDTTAALKHAGVYRALVRERLGAEPDPEVRTFVDGLKERGPQAPPGGRPQVAGTHRGSGRAARTEGTPAAPSEHREETEEAEEPGFTATELTQGPGLALAAQAGRWGLRLAVVALAALGLRSLLGDSGPPMPAEPAAGIEEEPAPLVVLASATRNAGGRDPATALVECEGPACPATPLPTNAFLGVKNPAYGAPVAGTGWISTVPDGTAAPPPGYDCCTTAVFETTFPLPSDAVVGRLTLSVLADNQVRIAINGVEFGRQEDPEEAANYGGPPSVFSTAFPPDPTGVNRLRLTLWDGGGALGLHYQAFVTWEGGAPAPGAGAGNVTDGREHAGGGPTPHLP